MSGPRDEDYTAASIAAFKAQGCACTGRPCGQHVCPERYAEKYVPPPVEFPDNGPSESF